MTDKPYRNYSLAFVVITMLMVGILLARNASHGYQAFRDHQQELMQHSVIGTANEITLMVEELQRSVQLFADAQRSLLDALADNPYDEGLDALLEEQVSRYFPLHHSYTLTTADGIPLIHIFDTLLGDLCQTDIQHFSRAGHTQDILIHPRPGAYHFDVMARMQGSQHPDTVFFVSFGPEMVARVLRNAQMHHHQLILVRRDRPNLVEIAAGGSRDVLSREAVLSPAELSAIGYTAPVPGTQWNLIDLPPPKLYRTEQRREWAQNAVVMALFLMVSISMLYFIRREERRRSAAEERAHRHQNDLAHVSRLSTMGEMASGIAHEINQPLSAIVNYARGCTRRLRAGNHDQGAVLDAIEQIATQAERAAEIIRRLRNFLRKGEVHRVPLQINALVKEVRSFLAHDAQRAGVQIQLHLTVGEPRVYADEIQVEQVLVNLVRNGIDAVGAAQRPRPLIIITTAVVHAAAVRVSVRDNGPGLPPDTRDQLFHPFFTTKKNGLGMGLSISRSIITAHEGRMWAVSPPGDGTTVHFTLPLYEEHEN
jgi:signal transduction histidine kinase